MVLVDEYSRDPIAEIIRSVSTNTVIPVLDKILAMFGIPQVINSDNGAPFNPDAFASFAKHSGFRHRRVTECWPRGNAQAEGFNKPLMKAIRSAVLEQKNWKQEMYQFLRQYRATPHTSTKFSPHLLLVGWEPGTKLPCISTKNTHDNWAVHAAARVNDKQAKLYQKAHADKRNRAAHNDLHVGDTVLMRNDKRSNKLSTPFSHKPMVVTDAQGTAITAADDNHTVPRNTSRFKKMLDPLPVSENKLSGGESAALTETTAPPTPIVDLQSLDRSWNDAAGGRLISTTPRETPPQERPQRTRCVPRRLHDYKLS